MLLEVDQRLLIVVPVRLPQRMAAHRHPTVYPDHQRVQAEPDRDQPEPWKPDVGNDEDEKHQVGEDQERHADPPVAALPRGRDQLEGEAEEGQRPPSQPHLGQGPQAPPQREPDEHPPHDGAQDQEHAYRLRPPGGARPSGTTTPRASRTNVVTDGSKERG